jgi:hypothetical protein
LKALAEDARAVLGATCRGCQASLRIRLVDGRPEATLAPPAEAPVKPAEGPGEHLGRYVIEDVIARGVTSTVYRAFDPDTKRRVAVKALDRSATAADAQRFSKQVEVQARLPHPNVLPVYDRGTTADGRPWFATELLEAPLPLSEILAGWESGVRPEAVAGELGSLEDLVRKVLLPVADAVYVANVENEVVHGDLAPENVLLDTKSLRPYVADFGRARHLGEGEGSREGTARDAALFRAPEQTHGGVHPRTDVWQLGALLRVMLAGEWTGGQRDEEDPFGGFGPLPATSPPALLAVARKAMARDPEARYVNARQLSADLEAWLGGRKVRALEGEGGRDARTEERRRFVRRYGWVAVPVLLGLAGGLLWGTSVARPPETGWRERAQALETEVNGFEKDVNAAALAADQLTAAEAAGAWAGLSAQSAALSERLAAEPPSAVREALTARLQFLTGRFAPVRVRALALEGVAVVAQQDAGEPIALGDRLTPLPPGRWVVAFGSGAVPRLPLDVPLRVRNEPPSAEAVWATLRAPLDAAALPEGRALVPGLSRGRAVDVEPFVVARRQVTNAEWSAFLASLPEAEQGARSPTVTGLDGAPVAGITIEAARAYCAWRSAGEGVPVRLPTAAEWATLARWPACPPGLGDLSPCASPAEVLGIEDLADGTPEWVDGPTPAVRGTPAPAQPPAPPSLPGLRLVWPIS